MLSEPEEAPRASVSVPGAGGLRNPEAGWLDGLQPLLGPLELTSEIEEIARAKEQAIEQQRFEGRPAARPGARTS
jgi:hypothetical protein